MKLKTHLSGVQLKSELSYILCVLPYTT